MILLVRLFRYASQTISSWKSDISITGFKRIDFVFGENQVVITIIIMQTQAKFCLCFIKINSKLFICCTNAAINIISRSFTKTLKSYSCNYQYEIMSCDQHKKLLHCLQSYYRNSTNLHYQMIFYSNNTHIYIYHYFLLDQS